MFGNLGLRRPLSCTIAITAPEDGLGGRSDATEPDRNQRRQQACAKNSAPATGNYWSDSSRTATTRRSRTCSAPQQHRVAGVPPRPGREHDAEDAFQAVFLLLGARRRRSANVKPWRAGSTASPTARRCATPASVAPARRRAANAGGGGASTAVLRRRLPRASAVARRRSARLPEKYRQPFVLCCLQGLGRADAVRELGWKEGTVSSRLDRARTLLQNRLAHRGVTFSAVLTAVALCAAGPVPRRRRRL